MNGIIRFSAAFFLAALIFVSCQQTLTDTEKNDIGQELLQLSQEIMDQFNNRDTAVVYTNYCDDFTLVSRGAFSIMDPVTFKNFTEEAKKTIATREPTVYTMEDPRVEVYARNVANVYYTYTRRTTYENNIVWETRSATTWTFVKEDGRWKIKHAHISAGEDTYRAVENEPVWVLLNRVKPDKREQFEEFMYGEFFDKIVENDGLDAEVVKTVRILEPKEANEDGTYTYVFIMDPLKEGVTYDIGHYLSQVYGEEKAKELGSRFAECFAEPQTLISLVQTKY